MGISCRRSRRIAGQGGIERFEHLDPHQPAFDVADDVLPHLIELLELGLLFVVLPREVRDSCFDRFGLAHCRG